MKLRSASEMSVSWEWGRKEREGQGRVMEKRGGGGVHGKEGGTDEWRSLGYVNPTYFALCPQSLP